MTRATRPRPAAALWAALLAASLLPLGCNAAAPVAGQPAPAGSAPVAAAAPAAAALPAELQGQWEPYSRAFETSGPLTLHAQSITWKPCGNAARAIGLLQDDPAQKGQLLTLTGEPACQLGSKPISHLRLEVESTCRISVSAFQNPSQLAKNERLAWGLYTRPSCNADKPAQPH